ncbi:MAG: toprim domain-containing protein [Terrimicrobiaceae bacterium]|nr:toprim domain-containing protein [Terrimicrobiaceae bacterium]
MNSLPLHGEHGGGVTPTLADQLRAISLPALLAWHGLAPRPEGASFRAKSDHHNLVVTGNRWFDNRTGTGGAGAIDLQMHLTGEDFSAASRTLADQFRPAAICRQGIIFPSASANKSDSERLPFPQLMAKYAVKDDGNWSIARAYLVEMRGIEPAIVDELHAVGSIFANDHRPNPSLVFLHRTDCGKVLGATLRETRQDSAFRPCLGNKLTAWFAVGSVRDAHAVAAVESPIDALSYYCLYAGRTDRLAVVSCSGSTVPAELMVQTYDRRQSFVVALDNDAAGERGWKKAWDETADWSGFKITSDRPLRKDWNADLLAVRPPGKQRQRPQHSLFHA